MAKKMRNSADSFRELSDVGSHETVANRDVYADQQLSRSQINGVEGRRSRNIMAASGGIAVAVLLWLVITAMQLAFVSASSLISFDDIPGYSYEKSPYISDMNPGCYQLTDSTNVVVDETCYQTRDEVPRPQWHIDAAAELELKRAAEEEARPDGFLGYLVTAPWWKVLGALGIGTIVWGVAHTALMRTLDAQNLMNDTSDINQHKNDQHIAVPEEIIAKFDFFPDAGAHSTVEASALISHIMLSNKGLNQTTVTQRHKKDLLDEDGEVIEYKGSPIYDADGELVTKQMPMIDEAFGESLFDASGLPDEKRLRRLFDSSKTPYNPGGKNREKLMGDHKTMADAINSDWDFKPYEVQRPAGVYLVDTAPVNTMVLAITRGGKGQTYIEPMIDIWLREINQNNMVVNDPKGELLRKFYVPATMRGFQVVQFNLINPMKTDIYNPLGMAADAAREGDSAKCALYIENIADVFFPVDGADDPVWPTAANNAFKRAAYGLIDFYLEEERELRGVAMRTNMDPQVLEAKLDSMWGKVTLYNCYQLFVQLSSKKLPNPANAVQAKLKANEYSSQDEYNGALNEAEQTAWMWEGQTETDCLSLYFTATAAYPVNGMRTLIANADNSLKSMAGAEKMLASVYGIAITAMSFFTDPTISTLTSGTPSQNTDLGGLSFPRRMGVRFAQNFLTRNNLVGMQAKWEAFEDDMFTKNLGKEFYHEDIVGREGWARHFFKGKFPNKVSYLRLQLVNASTQMLVKTLYFRFEKTDQTSLSGKFYIKDPVTDQPIVKNGLLIEMLPVTETVTTLVPATKTEDEHEVLETRVVAYKTGHTTFPQNRLSNLDRGEEPELHMVDSPAIISTMVRYSDQPKAVFLVTPPHLMKYAKLILILLKQLVDLNFDKSYMTKASQKPLYKTRYMLDELGNLQSEGKGIAGFQTMLSIGLGQDQQFTIILQTLQQLRDVYGENVDRIVQGNTANIIFLKSTDDAMIEQLEKMSGKRHRAYIDSKTITKNTEQVIKQLNVEGKVSYTMNTKEEPVISYNDMAFITERNSIVFRAGDSPIWNRNEMILPMSWRLHRDGIIHPGHEYTLQTIPTLSSALDFDVRLNQPNTMLMLAKRLNQAALSGTAKETYQRVYDYSDYNISQLDPDVYSDEVMSMIEGLLWAEKGVLEEDVTDNYIPEDYDDMEISENSEVIQAVAQQSVVSEDLKTRRYAGATISREMLVAMGGEDGRSYRAVHSLERDLIEAYKRCRSDLHRDTDHFTVGGDGSLQSLEGKVLVRPNDETVAFRLAKAAVADAGSKVYSEDDVQGSLGEVITFEIEDEFYLFLAKLGTWSNLGSGEFERAMERQMRASEEDDLI